MKTIILRNCFFIAIVVSGSLAKANAKCGLLAENIKLVTTDTLTADICRGTSNIQKHVLAKLGTALEREKLLDKLSKVPSDFPEFFPNAKEEYLWREKIKIQTDANGRPFPQPEDQQALHVKNGVGERVIPQ